MAKGAKVSIAQNMKTDKNQKTVKSVNHKMMKMSK